MKAANLEPVTRRPPLILAALTLLAVLGFLGVNRLVHRFREQEKALARHLYERGQQAQNAGDPGAAIADFRAALSYNHENSQYQLSLARALRDTGRTAEAETRLISLWVWVVFLRASSCSTKPFSTTTMRFTDFGPAMPTQNAVTLS